MAHLEDRHQTGETNRKRWRVRWIEGTRDHSRSFSRKIDAERFLAETVLRLERGETLDARGGRQPLEPFARDWLARRTPTLEPSTAHGYESVLRLLILPRFGQTPISAIDRLDVETWIAENAQRGLSSSRIRQAFGVLAMILDDAVDARLVPSNRIRGARLPRQTVIRRHRYLGHADLHRLAAATGDPGLVLTLGYGGLRWGEAIALTTEDVDPDGQTRIHRAIRDVNGRQYVTTPKTGRSRTIYLPAIAVEHLDLDRPGLLFGTGENPIRNSNWSRRVWRPALEETGLAPLRIHELRHTAASLAVRAGASPLVVARMLGHADPSMTMKVYADLWPEDLRAVAKMLDEDARIETA